MPQAAAVGARRDGAGNALFRDAAQIRHGPSQRIEFLEELVEADSGLDGDAVVRGGHDARKVIEVDEP